jgi:hypothetical protein
MVLLHLPALLTKLHFLRQSPERLLNENAWISVFSQATLTPHFGE